MPRRLVLASAPRPRQASPLPMLKKHPWIFLLILFFLSVGAWIFFAVLAVNNAPEQIEPARF
jgi:hypothetical protein